MTADTNKVDFRSQSPAVDAIVRVLEAADGALTSRQVGDTVGNGAPAAQCALKRMIVAGTVKRKVIATPDGPRYVYSLVKRRTRKAA